MLGAILIIIASSGGASSLGTLDRYEVGVSVDEMVLALTGPFGESVRVVPRPLLAGESAQEFGVPGAGGGVGSHSSAGRATRISTACLLGSLLPGAGHAASETYLHRGLAFTLSFILTTLAGSTFLWMEEEGLGGRYAVAGGWVLLLGVQVIYVWSLVDAISLASSSGTGER